MILQALNQLYDRVAQDSSYGAPKYGYSLQKIGFVVVLEPDGTLFAVQPTVSSARSKHFPTVQLMVPGTSKTSGGVTKKSVHRKVNLLRNDLPYLLGWKAVSNEDGGLTMKLAKLEFDAFRDFHLKLAETIEDEEFRAVCKFLRAWDPARTHARQAEKWLPFAARQGVFQIRGKTHYVHEREAVREWWGTELKRNMGSGHGQCLITGEIGPIARTHWKIKGIAGKGSAEAPLVGFKPESFMSYGKDQAFNAPISEVAAFRYVTSLNALLDGPRKAKHRLEVANTTVVFWTETPSLEEDVFLQVLGAGSASLLSAQDEGLRKKIKVFLSALLKGRNRYGEELIAPRGENRYWIAGLEKNQGRIVVRFFTGGWVAELVSNLGRHFNDLCTVRRFDEDSSWPQPKFPSIQYLLHETCPWKTDERARRVKASLSEVQLSSDYEPEKRRSRGLVPDGKRIPPLLAGLLLDSILTGGFYPYALYTALMRRIAADRIVNYPRACIIKGYLVRNLGKEITVSLDTSCTDPAYRLGRLFATLEKTQLEAHSDDKGVPRINTTIRDRFYSAASATPGAVFPRLLRTYQHHLAKLEGGHKVNREKLVQEILDPVEGFPAHLGLADQGLFALGYYHQMNDFYRSKDERNARDEA